MLTAIYSNQGGREYNEDCCTVLLKDNLVCAVMADGLGGHGGGDIASRKVVDVIRTNVERIEIGKEITQGQLNDWFSQANESVLKLQNDACQMKTTLAILCICEDSGMVSMGHLGDSRIYHFVDGKVAFCTFDHSVSRMAVLAGEIELEEVRFHRDRSKLLKVVGKENVGLPEFGQIVLEEQQQHVFLLCTDGFWEYVTESEMESTLAKSHTPEEWIMMMSKILDQKVQSEQVSNDNNSAIALFI